MRGELPAGLRPDAAVAQRLAATLVADHEVPDAVYASAVAAFGEAGVVALLCLVGQYQTISGILVAFRIPVPCASTE